MPTSDPPLFYWDACVPLSYINGIPDRLPDLDALLSKSGSDFQLITSVLSITEVAYAASERDNGQLDPAIEGKIARLWEAGSPIKVVEVYELIALKAQMLMRAAIEKGWSLKPADAIHLATAIQLKVQEFHTYDTGLDKYLALDEINFSIGRPLSKTPHLPLLEAASSD